MEQQLNTSLLDTNDLAPDPAEYRSGEPSDGEDREIPL